jgi:peroxiredoxin
LPHLTDLYQRYHKDGLEVVLISDEPVSLLKEFVSFVKVPFPVLSDRRRAVHDDYGVDGIPFTLLIDRNGKVASALPGYSPTAIEEDFEPAIKNVLKGQ